MFLIFNLRIQLVHTSLQVVFYKNKELFKGICVKQRIVVLAHKSHLLRHEVPSTNSGSIIIFCFCAFSPFTIRSISSSAAISPSFSCGCAMEVNRKWPKCQVVYLTNYWSYAMEVYETRHVYYIVKEKFEEKLPGVLEKAIEQLRKQNRRVVLQCHGGVKASLKLDDILYFERDRRVTYVITKEKEYTVDEKIPEIEERIASDDFVRCHTSFLVNFSYVKECTKKKMLLENGKIVDISRSYWKKTEEVYVEWVKRWAR